MSRATSSRLISPRLGVAFVLVAAALAGGCSSDDGNSSGAGAGQPETTQTAASRTLTTPASEIPDEATVAFNQKITTLDPNLAVAQADVNAINLIGGRLYETKGDGTPAPALAESGKASKDGLSWTFTLRPDLTFSDGSKLTSADVRATIERALADESNVQGALYAPIEGVEAPDPRTVVIDLEQPYPDLPGMLAEEFALVLPADSLDDESFFARPVSAGPYVLESWQGGKATFEVNDRYFGAKPAVRKLRFVTIEDSNNRVAQLQSGQIDFAFDLPPSLLPTLEDATDVTASVVPGYGWYSLDMWNDTPPLDDARVRRAISLAIDRDRLSEVIWQGRNEPVSGFWPPTMAGYDPSQRTSADVAGAKKLLAGTSCADGCTIKLEYPPALVPFADQMALLIAADLKEVGIELKLVKVDFNTFYADLGGGKYQLALYGLYDFVNMPAGLLTYALSADGGINANFSGYSSPAATKLISQTLESTGQARASALEEINELFAEDQPFATLATWAYVPATRLPADVIAVESSGLLHVGATEQ